ncbi:hypothetical protein DL96DRAFT_1538483, partial [Flagelloscypha sp. PMI_526]
MPPTDCTIPFDPDVSGVGVRAAIYAQAALNFIAAVMALRDGNVSPSELDATDKLSTPVFITAYAVLLTTVIQIGQRRITAFHGAIVLSLSFINNTTTLFWCVLQLYQIQQEHMKDGKPAGWKDIYKAFLGRLDESDSDG